MPRSLVSSFFCLWPPSPHVCGMTPHITASSFKILNSRMSFLSVELSPHCFLLCCLTQTQVPPHPPHPPSRSPRCPPPGSPIWGRLQVHHLRICEGFGLPPACVSPALRPTCIHHREQASTERIAPLSLVICHPNLPFQPCTTVTSIDDLALSLPEQLMATSCLTFNFSFLYLHHSSFVSHASESLFWDCFSFFPVSTLSLHSHRHSLQSLLISLQSNVYGPNHIEDTLSWSFPLLPELFQVCVPLLSLLFIRSLLRSCQPGLGHLTAPAVANHGRFKFSLCFSVSVVQLTVPAFVKQPSLGLFLTILTWLSTFLSWGLFIVSYCSANLFFFVTEPTFK